EQLAVVTILQLHDSQSVISHSIFSGRSADAHARLIKRLCDLHDHPPTTTAGCRSVAIVLDLLSVAWRLRYNSALIASRISRVCTSRTGSILLVKSVSIVAD